MMLTIHGLPLGCKYLDLKLIIKQECNITDFILDNLVGDGDASKKVRIGVADEAEGSHLMKCLDGYRMGGNVLRVVPVAKAPMNQSQSSFDQRGGYPPRNEMPNQPGSYGSQPVATMGNRGSPWAQNTNQWQANQSTGPQRPQNDFGYQQQPSQPYQQQQQPLSQQQRPDPKQFPQRDMRRQDQPGYGFPQKSNAPDPNRRILRSVDISGASGRPAPQPLMPAAGRFHTDKPVTINKDYFVGSNQFGAAQGGQSGHFQAPAHNQSSPWAQPSQQQKPPPQFKPHFEEERKFPQSDKRPILQKPDQDMRMGHSAYKGFDKPFLDSPHGRPVSPHGRRISPHGRPVSPHGRRVSPHGRRVSPHGRRVSPHGRPVSPHGRRVSPHMGRVLPDGRRVSPHTGRVIPDGRRVSPHSGRAMPDDRRVSPHTGRVLPEGRRVSPHPRPVSPPGRMSDRRMSPGRRVSPSGRRMSPGRRSSPTCRMPGRQSPPRKMSPHKRFSPSRRLVSPRREQERRESPSRHAARFSPSRRPSDKMDKFSDSHAAKTVRPAYEPEAANQAMYSGGYRPNLHENVQYPIPGARQVDQRNSSWQQERDKAMFTAHMKKQDDERRDARAIAPPRGPEHRPEPLEEPKRPSPLHKSRSPNRRDVRERSPLRDRYRRHSPSPRSPRRSWALEKRRSPEISDAPPPPIWPGQSTEETFNRPSFPDRPKKEEPKKHSAWDRRPFNEPAEDARRDRRPAPEARPFNEPEQMIRIRTDLGPREPLPSSRAEPPPRGFKPLPERYSPKLPEPRFEPREEYKQEPRDYRRPENAPVRKNYPDREEFRDFPRVDDRENRRRDDFPRRDEFQRRDERKESFAHRDERPDQRKDHDMFQKEFEDIYKRAKEFKQKVEELRRPDRSKEEFREDRRRDLERGDDRRKMLADHSRDRRDEARLDYRHLDVDQPRQDERPRSRPADEYPRHRDLDWKDDKAKVPVKPISAESQAKRDKAAEEISTKILEKHCNFGLSSDVRNRVLKELHNVVLGIIDHMFGSKDISFIETVIKFNAKHSDRDEYKLFQEVMGNFPNLPKTVKRHGEGESEIPAKITRRTPENLKQDVSSSSVTEQHRSRPGYPEKSLRPKPSRAPTVRRTLARPDIKPRAPVIKKPLTGSSGPSGPYSAPNTEGQYELGPRTYRAVKTELDRILYTVWEQLPETMDVACEAERDIVERWKHELGDDLRDVIGLNVTKRLLNVFNPLNVKVHFSTKPDRKYLSSFLKRYNFVAFKRLTGVVNTFAAQVKTIADFDALCTAKSIHCGAAKITISPFYRFLQCPKKVKTMFCNPDFRRKKDPLEETNSTQADINSTKNEDASQSTTGTKAEPVDTKPTVTKITPKTEETKPTNTSTNKVPTSKVESAKGTIESPAPKVETSKSSKSNVVTPKSVSAPKPVTAPKSVPATKATPSSEPKPVQAQKFTPSSEPKPVAAQKITPVPELKTVAAPNTAPAAKPIPAPSPKPITAPSSTPAPKAVPVPKPVPAPSTVPATKSVPTTKSVQSPNSVPAAKAVPAQTPVSTHNTVAPKPTNAVPAAKTQTSTASKAETVKSEVETPKPKAEPAKTSNDNKPQPAKTEAKKPIIKAATQAKNTATVKAPAKPAAKPVATNTKVTKTVPTKNVPIKINVLPNKKAAKKAAVKDDFEELNDHDILALISKGIVLDECSGSEED